MVELGGVQQQEAAPAAFDFVGQLVYWCFLLTLMTLVILCRWSVFGQ